MPCVFCGRGAARGAVQAVYDWTGGEGFHLPTCADCVELIELNITEIREAIKEIIR